MSQPNRKYIRLEALLSESKPVDPNPDSRPVNHEVDELKARVTSLEAELQESQTKRQSQVFASDPIQTPIESKPGIQAAVDYKRADELNARNAFRVLAALLATQFLVVGFLLFQTSQTPSWQLWVMDGLGVGLMISEIVGLIQVRRGRHKLGIEQYFISFMIVLFVIPFMYSGFGLFFLVIGLTFTLLIGSQTLPSREARLFNGISITVGVAILLVDFYIPFERTSLPGFQNILYIALAFTIPVFVYAIVRQAIAGNIRTKVVSAFVVMTVLSVGIVGFLAQRLLSTSLTGNIGANLVNLANSKAIEIGQTVDRESDVLKTLALNKDIQNAAESANRANFLRQEEITRLDQQWRSADAANNNTDPLVFDVLYNSVSNELRRYQKEFSQHVEIFLTDRQGVNIATTNRTSDYYQADEEWWQTAYQEGFFIGQPEYDESSKTISIIMATALRDNSNGKVTGILRTTVNFTTLFESLKAGQFGKTGNTEIYLPNGQEITLETLEDGSLELIIEDASLDINVLTQSTEPYMVVSHNGVPTLAGQVLITILGDTDIYAQAIPKLNWHVVARQDQAEALQLIAVQTRNIIILVIVIGLAVIVAALFLARIITTPLINLKIVAEKVASGDLTIEAKVETSDEIGVLAATFNNMTSQLRSLFGSLEQRVQDRTHDLELAAEVVRSVTEKVSNVDDMLSEATELIRSSFDLYYTQVYLLDPTGQTLTLRAGTGDVGQQLLRRGHHLLVNSGSLNGRAVSEKKPIIVADTAQNPSFLPNPLLPNTRSEMVVPLIVSGRVLGVLDMQSEIPGALNQSNLPAFAALAGQISIAIQNAALFAQSEESRKQMEENVRQITTTGWLDFLNGIDRGEKMGYVFDQTEVKAIERESNAQSITGLIVPITVTGATVGKIQVAQEEREWTSSETEIVQSTADQLAQHIENLRLLAQTEKYRQEAVQTTRRLTRIGWEGYLETRNVLAAGYSFNPNEVKAEYQEMVMDPSSTLSLPINVRDEAIGELMINADNSDPGVVNEIFTAVAAQLGDHIENLRLLETTQYELAERTRAEQDLLKMRLGMDRATDAVFITDTDGTIIYCNPAFEKVYGWKPEEAIGQNPRIFKSGLVPQEQYKAFWGALTSKQVVAGEIVNKTRDGRFIPIEASNSPIIDANEKIIGYLGMHRDITERKNAQEIIARRASELQTVATVSSTAATVLDPDKLLQAVVDLTKERFNMYHAHIYLADESWNSLMLAAGAGEVGRQMVNAGHAIQMDAERSLVARASRERKSIIVNDVRAEAGFLPNPMLPETRSEMAVPMIAGDKVIGVFDVQADTAGHFTDEDANIYTTLASQVAVALQNARLYVEQAATVTQLRELDKLKSSFLANMSHELRTPLNSILGFADVMLEGLDGPLTDNMNNDLGLIQKNGQHLLHLINDVLDMAKIDSGKMNLNIEKFNLNELFTDVISITSTLAKEKSLPLVIEPDSDHEVEINADKIRLRQVMINLVNNAMKFTDKGGVSIRAARENDNVLISVKDTGIGIPLDQIETVFHEFTQVDTTTTRKAGGTGLGLPISRRLINMHSGRLWAESTGIDGEGSTFFVTLPIEANINEDATLMAK